MGKLNIEEVNEMQFDYSLLRGRIRQILNTDKNFAAAIDRTPQYISMVFKDKAYFAPKDIVKACKVLDIKPEEVGTYFFTLRVYRE